jgi:Fe-S-cluster containining protein
MFTPELQQICIECQECCKWMTFILVKPSQQLLHIYRVRDCKIKVINGNTHIMVKSVCPHLTQEGCDIYDKRPQICREYDGRYDPAMKYICKLPEWR